MHYQYELENSNVEQNSIDQDLENNSQIIEKLSHITNNQQQYYSNQSQVQNQLINQNQGQKINEQNSLQQQFKKISQQFLSVGGHGHSQPLKIKKSLFNSMISNQNSPLKRVNKKQSQNKKKDQEKNTIIFNKENKETYDHIKNIQSQKKEDDLQLQAQLQYPFESQGSSYSSFEKSQFANQIDDDIREWKDKLKKDNDIYNFFIDRVKNKKSKSYSIKYTE
ncbi:hypothetical protein PPERSA_02575 [Pseudocohnilembus persalinus]|uniref:Uncharacterized protein n=1 Tax=Pseudocohnilembus persalinus TaxID=266149 RepID=A0A0V0R5F5_PSEPJ|nr:hypothetical protein PPERSA_02575 [Pseudocohnilembus persalinus]|eukprot:KRX09703.1 hypothetical protein PPERSA_02575 [Pseudocohnilembus persalinus]